MEKWRSDLAGSHATSVFRLRYELAGITPSHSKAGCLVYTAARDRICRFYLAEKVSCDLAHGDQPVTSEYRPADGTLAVCHNHDHHERYVIRFRSPLPPQFRAHRA